jgi:hypothetical protein
MQQIGGFSVFGGKVHGLRYSQSLNGEHTSIRILGAGCSLIDYLYTDVDFDSPSFQKFSSRTLCDGGLTPGKLVFSDEFEKFSGIDFHTALSECTGGRKSDALKHRLRLYSRTRITTEERVKGPDKKWPPFL